MAQDAIRSLPKEGQAPRAAAGWKAVLAQTFNAILDDRVMTIAAGVAFYVLLAIFPLIAAFVAIYGIFADPTTVASELAELRGDLPYGAEEIIGNQLRSLIAAGPQNLTLTFALSLLISIYSSNSGTKALFDALNLAYGAAEQRSFLNLNVVSLLFTAALVIFSLIALSGIVVLPAVLAYLPLGGLLEPLLRLGRWVVLIVLVGLGLAALYHFGRSPPRPRWRWVTPGSATASLLWIAASLGLSAYAAHFANFNKTYGSLGAAVGFMIWLWVSFMVILAGAELDAAIAGKGNDQDNLEKPAGAIS